MGSSEGGCVLSGCIERAEFLDNIKDCHFSTRNPSLESFCDFTFLFILFFTTVKKWICLKWGDFINSLYWAAT